MRVAMLMLLFTGIILLVLNQLLAGPQKEVKMVYLPRSLDVLWREEPFALTTFQNVFTGQDVDPAAYAAPS